MNEEAKIKFSRMLADLLRDYARLQADNQTLAAILQNHATLDVSPIGWPDALEKMRKQPEYRSIAQQYDSLLVQLEQVTDFHEALHLLATLPTARVQH